MMAVTLKLVALLLVGLGVGVLLFKQGASGR
jgi:hypothetical protein